MLVQVSAAGAPGVQLDAAHVVPVREQEPMPHVASGTASSATPSQSSSMALQTSVAGVPGVQLDAVHVVPVRAHAPTPQVAGPVQAAVPATPESPAAATHAPVAVIAGTPPPARVCRYETQLGSNMRRRVCRTPSESALPSTEAAREMLRRLQGARLPDSG